MFEFLARHAFAYELVMTTLVGMSVFTACALLVTLFERGGAYRTRNAFNDLAYVIFYQCGIYTVLVTPLFIFLSPRIQFLRLEIFAQLPPIVSIPLCWLTFDFLNYWVHRLQHTVRPLWAFHSVHHTATELTLLTGNRIHAFEQLYVSLLLLIPVLLLGIQPRWLPIVFAQVFSETLQHARVNWSFGPLHRVVVSPLFHAFHHSVDERQHNGNYGRIFSCWDVLFGTFVDSKEPVRRFGVDGMIVPERLTAQFLHPFRYLASTLRFLPQASADARGTSAADPAAAPQ